jgi:hypothetical protein
MDSSEPAPQASSRRLKGCLHETLGEFGGVFVLGARGLDALLQKHPPVAWAVITGLSIGFVYGLVWTIRIRPGLYLEHLRSDPVRRLQLGAGRQPLRIAGMAFMQGLCAVVVGYGFTLLVWSRP